MEKLSEKEIIHLINQNVPSGSEDALDSDRDSVDKDLWDNFEDI